MSETLAYCESRNLDLWRINVLAHIAVAALEDGRWTEAADAATRVLEDPRDSPWPHAQALLVLALVRARRGDPDARVPLDEALRLDIPPDEVEAHDDRAAAHAEIAWLERRLDEIDAATAAMLSTAASRETMRRPSTGSSSGVASPGSRPRLPPSGGDPFALCLAGAWEEAAAEWTRRGRPYEAALALAETGNGGVAPTGPRRTAAARRASGRPARVTAPAGARRPRTRPRDRELRRGRARRASRRASSTSSLCSPTGSGTPRSPSGSSSLRRTVDHHVSAILRKLEAGTRGEAVARAGELGLLAA